MMGLPAGTFRIIPLCTPLLLAASLLNCRIKVQCVISNYRFLKSNPYRWSKTRWLTTTPPDQRGNGNTRKPLSSSKSTPQTKSCCRKPKAMAGHCTSYL